jgi:hypothetical protein
MIFAQTKGASMSLQTVKIQHVVEVIKTWSPPEQLELIQAITKLLQSIYTFSGNNKTQVTETNETLEHQAWLQLSQNGLHRAYSDDEPEYTLEMIQEANPVYEAR